jgi:heme-degrading monooxygenase HmoA
VVSRHWKGIAKPGQADAYVEHLATYTFPKLAGLAGFVQALILRRTREEGTEFQIVTVWESLAAIRAFSGDDATVAVVPAAARALLVSYDAHAVHYDVVRLFDPH